MTKETIENRPLIGLGVLIFKDNKILLGKRNSAHGKFSWGPPGGHLEFGETFEDCAIREVLEEIGLKIPKPEFVAITNDFFEKEQKHYVSIFMKVIYPDNQAITNLEPHKILKWDWFSLDDLPENLFLPFEQLIANQGYGNNIIERVNVLN